MHNEHKKGFCKLSIHSRIPRIEYIHSQVAKFKYAMIIAICIHVCKVVNVGCPVGTNYNYMYELLHIQCMYLQTSILKLHNLRC